MFDWIKKLVVERLVARAIGGLVSFAAASAINSYGVKVDPLVLTAKLFAGWEVLAHVIETKTAGTKLEWIGKVL